MNHLCLREKDRNVDCPWIITSAGFSGLET